MMSERAYSHIDRGTATAGNRWFERAWQLFNGQTFSLESKRNGFDWLTSASAEVSFSQDGEPRDAMSFPEVDIAEHANSFGAGITVIRTAPGIRVTSDTTALHEISAYTRRHRIMNSSDTEIAISDFALEMLAIGHEGSTVAMGDFVDTQPSLLYAGEAPAIGVEFGSNSMLFGVNAPAVYDMFEARDDECTLRLRDAIVIPPFSSIDLPIAYVAVYDGSMIEASQRVLGELRLTVREMAKPRTDEDE